MLLAVENLVKEYKRRWRTTFRLEASFTVEKPEIIGVMGPNGSGKTTLFNCITGLYRAAAGSIVFGAPPVETTHLRPHDIVERGIARTFQTLRVFPNLSVEENEIRSSVKRPHCCFTLPFSCFQLPSMRSQFMCSPFIALERAVPALTGTCHASSGSPMNPDTCSIARRGHSGRAVASVRRWRQTLPVAC